MKTPNKLLGQNFLKCRWVIDTLINTANLNMSDTVLEIGPGTGVLTQELLKKVKKVIAVEKDKSLIENLQKLAAKNPNLEIIEGDILTRLNFLKKNLGGQDTSYKVVANIPYYLTSRLLRQLLEEGPRPESIVITIQKEVGMRICAHPPKMSLLSLSVQVFGRPEIIKEVPPECFWPKPKVSSAILKIAGISDNFFQINNLSPSHFFKIAKIGFSQKRKFLLNNLAKGLGDKTLAKNILEKAGLDPKIRAEGLTPEKWAEIARLCA